MILRIISCSVTVVILAHVSVSAGSAQARLEAGPFLAYYRPIGTFGPTEAYSVTLPQRPSDQSGPALGVRGRLWLTNRFGIELQGAHVWSTIGPVNAPGGAVGPTSVRIFAGAAQGLYEVASSAASQFWVSAGGGLVRHGGESFGRYGSPTPVAATLGLGSTIHLEDGMNLVLGLTTYFYSLEVQEVSGLRLQRGFQIDPLVQVGFIWGWRGGA